MFALHKKIKALNGQILIPYLVDGDAVYCQTTTGKIVVKRLKDFDFITKEEKVHYTNVVSVAPTLEPEDNLFIEDEPVQDIIIEPEKDEDVQVEFLNDDYIAPIENNDDTPEPKPEPKPVKIIYDDSITSTAIEDEDYI